MDPSKAMSWGNKVLLSSEGIFNAGEESGCKADPEQVAIDMINARNKDNAGLFSREEWLSRNQIQAYFSRLSVLRWLKTVSSTFQDVDFDGS